MKMVRLLLVVGLSLFSAELLAQKSLITAKGDSFGPGLAKSWSKAGEGKLTFVLDTSKEVSRGKKVTGEMVKTSVEEKLKSSHSAAVNVTAPNKIDISFKGAEKDFLTQLAKVRVRPDNDIKVAAAGTVSDTGIRAKIAARNPGEGEIKVKAISGDAAKMNVLIIEIGKTGVPAELKSNSTVVVKGITDASIVGKVTIVKVGANEGGVWSVSEVAQ